MRTIKILDCTLRDGGLGLEDAYKNNIADKIFKKEEIDIIVNHLMKSNLDIIELGSIEISNEDKTGFSIYQNIEQLSKLIPQNKKENQMYVGLFRGPDTPINMIPERNSSLIDGVRVIIRYSEMEKSLEFCASLAKKGYKVYVQPMLTMRYSQKEIDLLIKESNKMGAYALYFVDSYGYMQKEDVIQFVSKFDKELNEGISIGFHAHNNMNLAYTNALEFLNQDINREIIIDSCAIGMGQGAGNLQTELISNYMIHNYGANYNFEEILNVCDIIEKYLSNDLWGYSVTRMLPAIYKTAYKYSLTYRNKYAMSFSEINNILSCMPDEYRHRYTEESAKKLLELSNNLSI